MPQQVIQQEVSERRLVRVGRQLLRMDPALFHLLEDIARLPQEPDLMQLVALAQATTDRAVQAAGALQARL